MQFTIVGDYISITDFIYDIEDDEQLNFEIKNLSIQPYTTTTTKTTTVIDGSSTSSQTEKTSPFKKITEITSSASSKATNSSSNTNKENSNNTINNTTANTTNSNTTNNTNNSTKNSTNSNTNNKTVIYDPEWVEVTFKVENIGVTLD